MDTLSLKNQELIKSLVTKISNEDTDWLLLQVHSDLLELNLTEKNLCDYINGVILKNKLGWNHKTFKTLKQKEEEQDAYTKEPFEVEEGVVQCIRCKSFKVYSVSVQTRSSDEPITTMAQCAQCRKEWCQNG